MAFSNDVRSTPDQLVDRLLNVMVPDGGTNFNAALQQTRTVMEANWSTDL